MFPIVPDTAPKRFVPISAVTGSDALLEFLLPRSLFHRYIAVRILRTSNELPKKTNAFWQMLAGKHEPKSTTAANSIGFMYQAQVFWIVSSRGHVMDAATACARPTLAP